MIRTTLCNNASLDFGNLNSIGYTTLPRYNIYGVFNTLVRLFFLLTWLFPGLRTIWLLFVQLHLRTIHGFILPWLFILPLYLIITHSQFRSFRIILFWRVFISDLLHCFSFSGRIMRIHVLWFILLTIGVFFPIDSKIAIYPMIILGISWNVDHLLFTWWLPNFLTTYGIYKSSFNNQFSRLCEWI